MIVEKFTIGDIVRYVSDDKEYIGEVAQVEQDIYNEYLYSIREVNLQIRSQWIAEPDIKERFFNIHNTFAYIKQNEEYRKLKDEKSKLDVNRIADAVVDEIARRLNNEPY
jgi:hypothetical protein